MGNESSVFEGPPTSPTKEASGKKRIACDEETSVFEIVGTMQSTIVSRSASHSSRNAVNVSVISVRYNIWLSHLVLLQQLAWIFTRFMGEHPEIRRQQMTSEDVVERIIKPETKRNKKERYADLLKDSQKNQGGKELVSDGHPFFFVVHVWTQPFADMVDQVTPCSLTTSSLLPSSCYYMCLSCLSDASRCFLLPSLLTLPMR